MAAGQAYVVRILFVVTESLDPEVLGDVTTLVGNSRR